MEAVVQGLAENNYAISLANLGGIIAFLALLYGIVRWAYRFATTAYRENVKVAIYRSRRRNYLRARRAALDLHTFISMVVVQGVQVLIATLMCVVGLITWTGRFSMPPDQLISGAFNVSKSWDTVVATIMLYAPLALLIFLSWRLLTLARNTRRVRSKLMVRKWRSAVNEAVEQH